ncbi:MAG: HAD-IIIA family hydrolase [Fusobacterium gastrosuis]|uniref:KdsC family phosphatase n=2 Tax=Fusobacteriaceae TaxID=203492 RepID=UPI001F4FBE22|nr:MULTISPECIES: HAD-IIIA family hydrolase [Fusobacterium]MCI7224302.1 HAD-IIIA family hydrolase [Fusobacterium sp.]MDD7410466.1 HAD-IIIA family hydrolase [Fusobacteriaceae bacterium]MDY4011608.1 HAD-IIIA family hydrolase [Fusobacterium gastrosuis]MDY5712799.1 HAD-IIIA family hydrolase [Fusobacterium gastrosuis]
MEKIKLLVLDVDGTLTNGKLYIDNYLDNLANEGKAFHVRDGFAMVNWLKQGGEIAILTGKYSNIVSKRAEELGIKYVIQASKNKTKDLKKLLSELNLDFSNVAYMGDDVNDIGVMLRVACPACPADAVDEVRNLSNIKFISSKNGGDGAVREFLEYIMKNNGMWKKVLDRYMNEE